MNIAEVLSNRAAQMGEAVAIRDVRRGKDRAITFAELERQSAQSAALFLARGLKPGDTVLFLHGMSIELYVALIGIFRSGMVAMFLDPSAGLEHVRRCCALQAPAGFIGSPKAQLLRLASSAMRCIAHSFVIGPWMPGAVSLSASRGLEPLREISRVHDDAPALLTFTSGSTGQPKGAIRSHGFLLAQHRVLERSIALRPGQVDLTTLPVFGLANLGSGVTSLIPDADLRLPGAIDPKPVLAQIRRFRPNRTAGSPSFYECMLAELEASSGNHAPASPMKVYTGGAPVFPRLLTRLQAAFGEEPEAVYGSTEAEPIAHLSYSEITSADSAAMRSGKGLLAGHPVPEIELRILRDQWGRPLGTLSEEEFAVLVQPADAPGEIVVHGPHVLTTYLHGRGNEETKFSVGGEVWHRTGDLGYLDSTGRLWLLGRCVAKITDAKGTLYPFAVECVAHQFDWVRLAGCVGAEGKRYLALQASQQPSDTELQELRAALDWALIDEFHILDRLPVDNRHNAKIDYASLRVLLDTRASAIGKA